MARTLRYNLRPGSWREDPPCIPCGKAETCRPVAAILSRTQGGWLATVVSFGPLTPWAIAAISRLILNSSFAQGPVATAAAATEGNRAAADGDGGDAVVKTDDPAGETGGDGRAEPPAA